MMAPLFITRMMSAKRIVESLWAITKHILSFINFAIAFLDQHLGSGINVAGRLVQNEDRRVGKNGAGDGQKLFLALGNVGRLFCQSCLFWSLSGIRA